MRLLSVYLMRIQSVKMKIIGLEKMQVAVGGSKGVNLPYRHGSVDSGVAIPN
jgi:hypothetical protein